MQIVVPMAGIGKRFLDAGYTEPKPLIEVHGKPMIEHIVDLFRKEDDFVFIVNESHIKKNELREKLLSLRPGSKVVSVLYEQMGPVWDTLKASDYVEKDAPTIVTYCDFNMSWDRDRFNKMVEIEEPDGAIFCYTGFHPHLYGPNKYAGVRIDKNNIVVEVKEKHSFTENKMKSWHSNGTYYFKNGATAIKYFQELINKGLAHKNGEYYVSEVYNPMIKNDLKVILYPLNHFCQWGTPEDLEHYKEWHNVLDEIGQNKPQKIHLQKLKKRIPHITETGHRKSIEYWREFRNKMLM